MDGLNLDGFSPPISLASLHTSRCAEIPLGPGVYVVIRDAETEPEFLPVSPAGWFKGQDPGYALDRVKASWVPGAHVVYIGKAAGAEGLRQRIRQLVDFGFGKNVGHWGGRMLWHLADHSALQLRWLECRVEEADRLESELIASFRRTHGVRPFANKSK